MCIYFVAHCCGSAIIPTLFIIHVFTLVKSSPSPSCEEDETDKKTQQVSFVAGTENKNVFSWENLTVYKSIYRLLVRRRVNYMLVLEYNQTSKVDTSFLQKEVLLYIFI